MSRLLRAALCGFLLVWFLPAASAGQPAPQAPPAEAAAQSPESSGLWLVVGGGLATLRGDCQTCEEDFPYRHSGSILAVVGHRVTDRMDVGVEAFWMPVDTADGHIRTTHLDAVAQFRPWVSQGFFVKGGAGMAFVRNWVDVTGSAPITSKALSLVLGAGWVFRPSARVGLQLFGLQHAAALGDLQTASGQVPDVIGNYWSIGAALVFR